MDRRESLRQLRARPGLFLGRGDLDFEKLVVYLLGMDAGTGHHLLDGFREYLILRLGAESSLWWPGLVVQVCVPHAAPQPETGTDVRAATDGLFDLLDEFLAEFPETRSRGRLHQEYLLWKQRQSHHLVDLERFRSSPPPEQVTVEAAIAELGTTRAAFFDLVAAGELEIFRDGPATTVRASRLAALRDRRAPSPP